MNELPKNHVLKGLLFTLTGVCAAVFIINMSKIIDPKPMPDYYNGDVSTYYQLQEINTRARIWWEIAGLAVGFFAGGLVTTAIATHHKLLYTLLVPPISILIIPIVPWHLIPDFIFEGGPFAIPYELVVLALPAWIAIVLLANYAVNWYKLQKETPEPESTGSGQF